MNSMQGGSSISNNNVMGGGTGRNVPKKAPAAPATFNDDDDGFGDFSGSGNKSSTTSTNADPMSRLIQLDSLTLNSKKEDKTKQPIIYNAAAATAMNTKNTMAPVSNPDLSFSGIDGLNRQVDISMKTPISNRQPGQPIMVSNNAAPSNNTGMQGGMGMGMQQQQQGMMGNGQGGNMMGGGMMVTKWEETI